ncbi:hypothetical protein [Lactiplantibacillus plajomi]|uniref:Integral membrane protein n=1 Tax=Lactiplantibacillus plajomi TaxID=1457217 RepID=A0ABV6K2K6_9LACO|nr:hypothetical protein [Lactiplantibacillus plajomi]
MTRYQFHYSRLAQLTNGTLGAGLLLVGSALNLSPSFSWLLHLFGLVLGLAGIAVLVIAGYRLLGDPVVLAVTADGIDYYYGTLNRHKRIHLPWSNIRTIKIGDVTYHQQTDYGTLPLKVEYVTITVTPGFLASYSALKDNLFLSGDDLRIVTSQLRHFRVQKLTAGIDAYRDQA